MTTTASGLQFTDTKVGEGASPKTGQTCVMHYTGWLYKDGVKGAKFDSSLDRGDPFEFAIGTKQVIGGWDEGVASHESWRQAHAHHSARAWLWRTRRRRRHPAQRHADVRCRVVGSEVRGYVIG